MFGGWRLVVGEILLVAIRGILRHITGKSLRCIVKFPFRPLPCFVRLKGDAHGGHWTREVSCGGAGELRTVTRHSMCNLAGFSWYLCVFGAWRFGC